MVPSTALVLKCLNTWALSLENIMGMVSVKGIRGHGNQGEKVGGSGWRRGDGDVRDSTGALLGPDGKGSRGSGKEARPSAALLLSLHYTFSTIPTISTTMTSTTSSTIHTSTVITTTAKTTPTSNLPGQGHGTQQNGMMLHRKGSLEGLTLYVEGWRSGLFILSYCTGMLGERVDSQ